jgi:hypothetical protein
MLAEFAVLIYIIGNEPEGSTATAAKQDKAIKRVKK